MTYEDFDVDSLAAYLHLTPSQILRLATRDRSPGRRVGGDWKFSRAEIHHWLEDRIGVSDDEQLQQMEGVLERHASVDTASSSLQELLLPNSVIVPLEGKSRTSVIDRICDHAFQQGLLWDASKMAEAIRARENLHPTALDNGVALLHPRRPMTTIMADPFLMLARTFHGIPFGGPRGNLTDIFFLIASVNEQGHLRTLARLSRILASPSVLTEVREAETPQELYDVFIAADESIDS